MHLIPEFETAMRETEQIIDRKRAAGGRHVNRAITLQENMLLCRERLADMPDELQNMVAYQIQHHNGGYLHLDATDSAWRIVDRFNLGERFHNAPMTYKSLL